MDKELFADLVTTVYTRMDAAERATFQELMYDAEDDILYGENEVTRTIQVLDLHAKKRDAVAELDAQIDALDAAHV
jgi:hypothetical protein